MSISEQFNQVLQKNTPAGFNQFYHVAVEATGGPFTGRYFYLNDGFYEVEFGRSDLIFQGKKLNEEKLYKSIEEGYASLVRIPKAVHRQYKFEYLF